MMRMMKNPASEAMNAHIPTVALSKDRSSASFPLVFPLFFGSRSQSGRRPRTGGTFSKLCGDGGDVVAHSSVHASHGLSPAFSPRLRLQRMLPTKTSTDSAMTNAPTVDRRFRNPQCGRSGYVY